MGANYSNYKSWEMPRTGGGKRVKLDLFTLFPREREREIVASGVYPEWAIIIPPPHVPWASAISLLTFFSESQLHSSLSV